MSERLSALEAASLARAAERSKSSAKGMDFEDLLEDMLADCAQGAGDTVERTGSVSGDVIRSKKGDFLLTIDPQWCHGADLRVVIEAKNRRLSWPQIREELDSAKRNRGASVALAVFAPEHAPRGWRPLMSAMATSCVWSTRRRRTPRPLPRLFDWPGCMRWPRRPQTMTASTSGAYRPH